MKILFLCTAHNSLSQRLYLVLSASHDVCIEYALSDEVMVTACNLWRPDLIICPFLTTLVPKLVYEKYLTLIVHPGPPGDAGPSALDWLLLGDDGSFDDADETLHHLGGNIQHGRTHWGVTLLQAIEEFDAGPVWAYEQFPIDIDDHRLTKSGLYRGALTQAAVTATVAAVNRIQDASYSSGHDFAGPCKSYNSQAVVSAHVTLSAGLLANKDYGLKSVTEGKPFKGGRVHLRPLLKAQSRDFNLSRHTALQISRRIRSSDSQPGVLSTIFGPSLYLYGGQVDDEAYNNARFAVTVGSAKILATRNDAVCIATCDKKGIWITHTRRPKSKTDKALWPKVPATTGLQELDVLWRDQVRQLKWDLPADWSLIPYRTFQEVWIDFRVDDNGNKAAYLYFNFYNGAMSTNQCSQLICAMEYILTQSTKDSPVRAVVLMGGSYFSNGIALNVIENAADPAEESWFNINRINDVVHGSWQRCGSGVALAVACDIVISSADIVLNPAYRAVGLHGSEFHTISYFARCGQTRAKNMLRSMTPISPLQARQIGLVDYVFPGMGEELDDSIRFHVDMLLKPGVLTCGYWKSKLDLSAPNLAHVRALELSEMCKDFWSARNTRYNTRRFDFVRKVKATQTPLRFAIHRRNLNGAMFDEEELDSFDDVAYYENIAAKKASVNLRDLVRHELGNLVAKWAKNEVRPQPKYANGPVRSLIEQDDMHLAGPGRQRKMSTVFSCYYKPVEPSSLGKEPMTPPMSPLKGLESAEYPPVSNSLFRAVNF
ncbi:Hydrogenase maturation factor HoxX [Teratosphaeria destructans]|uniref:Hydrogenase maturation factor HoxX n=1 Tax=Teratosphaeria destructans TaxID=418781 RepID=A0A9W7SX80_9PEZI|nr:Hydrogenase maturation factor HoxX [Teratosphaeria destructans]